jgi:hypothetical protein
LAHAEILGAAMQYPATRMFTSPRIVKPQQGAMHAAEM